MKNKQLNKSKGQILVIVAVMLVGLLAMLALVLDGGNLYTQRRQAQLAADAGALAGARAYCITESATAAVTSAYDYAVNRNGADNANVIVNGELKEVTVDTTITFETFFLHIFGRSEMTAPATATAVCSPPTSARNVLPIAWSCRPPYGESDSEDCEMYWMDHDEDDDDGECIFGEDPIYIIMDSEKVEEEIVCQNPNSPLPSEEGVIFIDCDLDDDGKNDIDLISGGNRAWLNLDGDSGNASELKDWVENGYEYMLYPHTWIPATTGNVTAVYKGIADNLLEKDVIIPVFNAVCPADMGVPGSSNPDCDWHSGLDTVVPTSGNADYFHIISFSLFRPICVDAGSVDCPAHEAAGLEELDPNINTVEGCFIEGFDPDFGSGGGEIDTGTLVVHLVH